MKEQMTMNQFRKIIEKLRSETGCPWDKEQTHNSLRPCMMEEAAELLAAIRIYEKTGDFENMQEELGDILLQVVMHSQIAEEENLFNFDDVVQGIGEKMIRRHPHVFADTIANTSREVLKNWDEIKKQEKEGQAWITSPLREIPIELPALTRATKTIKKMDKLYEPLQDYQTLIMELQTLTNNLKDLEEEEKIQSLEATIREILWKIACISQRKGLVPEQLLNDQTDDFIEKYEKEL